MDEVRLNDIEVLMHMKGFIGYLFGSFWGTCFTTCPQRKALHDLVAISTGLLEETTFLSLVFMIQFAQHIQIGSSTTNYVT